jgi:hypothetical protein
MTRIIYFLSLVFVSPVISETLTEGLWADLSSPVTTNARGPLIAGSATTLFLYAFKYEIGDPLQRSWTEHKPLGKSSKYGDDAGQMIPNALYALGMAIDGWGFENEKSKARSILMLKASIYSGVVGQALKYSFREPRPSGSRNMASFPSGHATSAFAFAAVVGAEHEWYYGLAAYSLATFVAASRINDNQHRLHDVVGGATLGMSYGLGLFYRQHPTLASKTVFQLLPSDRLDGFLITGLREF